MADPAHRTSDVLHSENGADWSAAAGFAKVNATATELPSDIAGGGGDDSLHREAARKALHEFMNATGSLYIPPEFAKDLLSEIRAFCALHVHGHVYVTSTPRARDQYSFNIHAGAPTANFWPGMRHVQHLRRLSAQSCAPLLSHTAGARWLQTTGCLQATGDEVDQHSSIFDR